MDEFGLSTSAMKTARLELWILQESHINDFHAIWTNPAATKWTTRGISHTLEESKTRLASLFTNPEKSESLNYGVFVRSSPPGPDPKPATTPTYFEASNTVRMIGIIGIFQTPSHGIAEVGYIFNQSFWGQGYASEALAPYLEIYWERVKTINSMMAKVDPENIPSVKVLKKCGFEEIEHLVGDIVLPELGRRDTLVFRVQRPGFS